MHLQHDEATSTEADGMTGRNLTMMLNVTDEPPALLPRPTPPASENAKARPRLPRWPVPVVAVLVSAATVAALVVLWRWIDGLALADAEKQATAQLDALKLAASIVVGGGGLFALYLAARRQRTQEQELDARHAELAQRDRVQAHVEQLAETNRLHAERVARDARVHAEAQRITELYGKSVEQLGSDKAPVRLGGLYALERLAQDNPDRPALRQTVVNVICAYLRMPFKLPGAPPVADADEPIRTRYDERVQEREVRLTAQRILVTHLRLGSNDLSQPVETFWHDIDLDVTGAYLIDFDLKQCQLRRAVFSGATFEGDAWFNGTTFNEDVRFNNATFISTASFRGVTFTEQSGFDGANFAGSAWFSAVMFWRDTSFDNATFSENVWFNGTTFGGEAGFFEARFDNGVRFSAGKFAGSTWFNGTTFAGRVHFKSATFVIEEPDFSEALTAHPLPDHSSWPAGWQPADNHGPIEGRKGTWHRLIRVASVTAGDEGDESTSTS